jgi:predicted acyl esterase
LRNDQGKASPPDTRTHSGAGITGVYGRARGKEGKSPGWRRLGGVRRALALSLAVTAAGVGMVSCSTGAGGGPQAPAATEVAAFSAHGSTESAYVLGARPGEKLILADSAGEVVDRAVADRFGSLVFSNVAPGGGYTVRSVISPGKVAGTKPFRVLALGYVPPTSLYTSQHLHVGMNYIRMRDGIYINATVRLPEGKTLADGPFPTVIEYSGYQTAAPGDLLQSILSGKGTSGPLLPSTATAVGSLLAPLLGFASVSVQMRGTGCSGGAFDLFGPNTTEDGYDVVETVAHQPWVKDHKVGMVGISFSGISQWFVAGTRPPGLAAIASLSTTNDLYDTGFPGGMLNDGFAAQWLQERFANAQPAPSAGALPYADYEVAHGDKQCIADQRLHLQAETYAKYMAEASFRVPSLYDPRSPELWASKVDVPVYVAGAFQDEQTGGQWPELLTYLVHDPHVYATLINGTHVDSLGPNIIGRWLEFLQIFVANEVPHAPAEMTSLGNGLYEAIAGTSSQPIPPLRFTNASSPRQARSLFEKETPRVRVLFDNGGSPRYPPGAMGAEWEEDFSAWPPPPAKATRMYLAPDGLLATRLPKASSVSFRPDPSLRPPDDLPKGSAWAALPPYVWEPLVGSSAIGFVTPPLRSDLVVAGPAALDVWVKSSASDTDLQATISEVRPDGRELFVTTGDLRASLRALDPAHSSVLHPQPTYLKSTASPLPRGRYVEVQIPLNPFAYAFRAGSRIRVTVEAPGDDRPSWEFDTYQTGGKVVDTVELGGAGASSLVLPVLAGVKVPDPQPACPSLRGQPCRNYVPAGNGG